VRMVEMCMLWIGATVEEKVVGDQVLRFDT
jgi:hypothetical protein